MAAGAAAAAFGIAALVAWQVGAVGLARLHPSLAPLQPDAALGIVLAGAACGLPGLRQPRLAAAFGAAAAALGLLTLGELAAGADLGLGRALVAFGAAGEGAQPGRMQPSAAAGLVLLGAASAFAAAGPAVAGRPLAVGLMAAAVIGLGVVALFGFDDAAYGWAAQTRMAAPAAGSLVLLGAGLFARALKEAGGAAPLRAETPAAVGLVVLVVLLWQALVAQEREDIAAVVEAEAEALRKAAVARIEDRTVALSRMGQRWERRGGTPREEWEADAANYVGHHPGLQAIEWIDASYTVRWIVPLEGNEEAVGLDLGFEERRRSTAEAARAQKTPKLSRAVDLVQGGKGFLIFVPLFPGGTFDGFILGVVRFETLLGIIRDAGSEKSYAVALYDGGERILARDTERAEGLRDWRAERALSVRGVTWPLRVQPTHRQLAALRSPLPDVTLAAGLLLAAVVTFAVRVGRVSVGRAREVERVNRGLETEIGQRRQAERELDSLQRRLRLILECAGEGIYGLDTEGRTTFANPATVHMTGWDMDEMLGRSQHDLIHHTRPDGSPYPRQDCPIYAAFKDGRTHHVDDEVFWRKDGGSFPVEYVSSPIYDDDGRLAGAVLVFRDITERKRNEEALRRRTAELEAANRELESFAYSVSHDLRAPLRSMDGFSQALFEDFGDRLDGEARDHLMRIRAASVRMGQLIDGILTISRITRAELRYERVDLSALAREVAEELQQADGAREACFDIAPDLLAEGDAGLLRIVLQNLIGNAWKFTSERSRARIEVGRTEGDGVPAFYVSDNGSGFDPRFAHKLFRPFQRLHSEAEFEGTGIGLATVARIVHRHGGEAWADSELGEGTTVYFTLQPRGEST